MADPKLDFDALVAQAQQIAATHPAPRLMLHPQDVTDLSVEIHAADERGDLSLKPFVGLTVSSDRGAIRLPRAAE